MVSTLSTRRLRSAKNNKNTPNKNPNTNTSLVRKAVVYSAFICLTLNVAWQFGTLQYHSQLQDVQKETTATTDLPPEIQRHQMIQRQQGSRRATKQFAVPDPDGGHSVSSIVALRIKEKLRAEGKMLPRPQQQRPQLPELKDSFSKHELQKPVPAPIVCVANNGPQCSLYECPDKPSNATTHLPDFMKPYSSLHYGYGFVQRPAIARGLKMQTSGSAKSGSGCALSHKYRFLFVHVLKSGGTTVKGFLQEGLCGNTNLPCENGNDVLQIVNCATAVAQHPQYLVFSFVRNPYSRLYSAYAMAYSFRNHPKRPLPEFSFETFALGVAAVDVHTVSGVMERKSVTAPNIATTTENNTTSTTSAPDRRRRLQEKTVTSWLQQHVLKNYQDTAAGKTTYKYPTNPPGDPDPAQTWDATVSRPDPTAQKVTPHGNRYARPHSYSTRLQRQRPGHRPGPIPKNSFRKKLSYLDASHYEPQTNFLFSRQGCPVVDFIGHLETMHDDLKTVLTYIDSPELWKHFKKQNQDQATVKTDTSTAFGASKKQKDLGGNLQTAYRYDGTSASEWGAIQKAVADEYKRDFDLLGYDPTVVPN